MADEKFTPKVDSSLEDFWQYLESTHEKYNELEVLEYICQTQVPALQIFEGIKVDKRLRHDEDFPGKLLETHTADSGFKIYKYEHCVAFGVGDEKHFEGNRGRIISTVHEMFRKHIPLEWKWISFAATHDTIRDIAWAIARWHKFGVDEMPPSDHALEIYQRLLRNL